MIASLEWKAWFGLNGKLKEAKMASLLIEDKPHPSKGKAKTKVAKEIQKAQRQIFHSPNKNAHP